MDLAIRRAAVGAILATSAVGIAGCAPAAPPPAHVVVSIAPTAQPVAYEVRLAQASGPFRSVHTMRSGQTRRFAVPHGWVTVRIPGLCVVPAETAGMPTVEVRHGDCAVA